MISRSDYLHQIRIALGRNPVVMLLGPRQIGKTTLARELLPAGSAHYFDLEHPVVAQRFADPLTALQDLSGLVVIDEAQRAPGLFPVLRVLADRRPNPAQFLLLGSASPELSRQANESLAGRVEMIDVSGFTTLEVGHAQANTLWLRGGFPRSFLAADDASSMAWRDNFIRTFLERDMGLLGFGYAPAVMARFWTMLSHYHGQLWNAAELAASFGVTARTVNRYLDALEQTYMVRRLLPWHANVGKRLVKSPKIYIRDTGLFHALQRIGTMHDLFHHPKLGASWEAFVLEEVMSALKPRDAYFYNVHGGSELDLFFLHQGKRIGVEVKREDAPRMTRSMHVALADLELDHLFVIYPGTLRYTLNDRVEVLPFAELSTLSNVWK